MSTKIVNLRKEPYTVYIGRPGKGQAGLWGNPVAIGKRYPECSQVHPDAGSTLPCYRKYLARRLDSDKEFAAQTKALLGQTLGCFCKPGPCHGDVLVRATRWLNGFEPGDESR